MMYGSWDTEHERQDFLSFSTIFCPFTPKQPKKSKFWKNGKKTWRYYHFKHVYHKWQSYDVWFLRYRVRKTECFVILDHSLPFYPLNNAKNQNFEKLKESPGVIIILHKCTINDNNLMYGSWDMKRDRQNFLSFWTVFCIWSYAILFLRYGTWQRCNCHFSFWAIFIPFTSLTARKIKIL